MTKINIVLLALCSLLLFVFLSFSVTPYVYSQAAIGCWVTKVGNPDSDMNIPECKTNDLGIPVGSVDGACTPTGEYPADLTQNLKDEYEITLEGYNDEHVRYIYDLFRCLSGTRFGGYVYGTHIKNGKINIPGIGETIGMDCSGGFGNCLIGMTQMPGRPTTFKFILTHELGHVIQSQNPREVIHYNEMENITREEGGVSLYARAGLDCTISGGEITSIWEDYADTIAYFLHPQAGETTPACDPNKNPPNPFFGLKQYPRHLDEARKILLQ